MLNWNDLTFVYVEFTNGNKGFTLYNPQTIINLNLQYPGKCHFNY